MAEILSDRALSFALFWGIWLLVPLLVDATIAIVYLSSLILADKAKKVQPESKDLAFYPYVTVVIPIYNSAGTLKLCLESLLHQTYPISSLQIICIDNGSTDNSFEVFQKFQYQHQDISIMWASVDRPSKSIALNVGMYSGQGAYLINMDSDTWLDKHAILKVVKAFEGDHTLVAATGCIRVDKKLGKARSFLDMINYCEVVEYLIAFDIGRRYQHVTNTLFTLSGAFSVFRRETILKSFLYQERTVSEDTDLTFNIRSSIEGGQGRIGCVSDAIAYVEPIESLARLFSQRLRWQRGEIEVAAAYYKQVPHVFKALFDMVGRTLLTDHTLALAQMIWTFLLPFMFLLKYPLPTVTVALSGMFICYLLLDILYFFVAYRGAGADYRQELKKVWWIMMVLPLYRYMLFWFRLAGNIQVLTEPKSWKVQNPIDQVKEALMGYVAKLNSVFKST